MAPWHPMGTLHPQKRPAAMCLPELPSVCPTQSQELDGNRGKRQSVWSMAVGKGSVCRCLLEWGEQRWRAEVAQVISQAMQATFFLLLPSPCPCAKPQGKLRQAP